MIIRSKRSEYFTVIPNEIINDNSLDWKDLGILVYLLSKPDSWQVSVQQLCNERKLGRDAIYKCLDVLISTGYAKREKLSNGKTNWNIYDKKPNPENQEKATKHHIRKNPITENQEKASDSHILKTRNTEIPDPEKTTLINTEYKQIKEKNIKKRKVASISFKNLPTGISIEAAEAFIDHRKTMRKPLTQRAFDLSMAEAATAKSIGITPDQAIDETILAGWQTIKIDWIANRVNKNATHKHSDKQYQTKPKFDPTEILDRQQAAIMGSGYHINSYSDISENDSNLRSHMDEKPYNSEFIICSPIRMGKKS